MEATMNTKKKPFVRIKGGLNVFQLEQRIDENLLCVLSMGILPAELAHGGLEPDLVKRYVQLWQSTPQRRLLDYLTRRREREADGQSNDQASEKKLKRLAIDGRHMKRFETKELPPGAQRMGGGTFRIVG